MYFSDELPEGKEFEVIGDIKTLIEAEKAAAKTTEVETDEAKHEKIESTNGNGTQIVGEKRSSTSIQRIEEEPAIEQTNGQTNRQSK